MFLEFDFEVKILRRCVYMYFDAYGNLQAFIYYIIFQIIYIIFTIFQKVTKMSRLLWGNIHLRTITSLKHLSPEVRHFALNAVGEAGENGRVWRHLAIFNH